MTTIHNAYVNALLADAAYVGNLAPEMTGQNLLDALRTRMTTPLAQYIGENFTVVKQIESDGPYDSSFDAVVWRENKTGKLYVSMRGTQQPMDFAVDADLALSGNACAQLVEMVNWWLRETTTEGQSARQIWWNPITSSFEETTSKIGTGKIKAADLVGGIEVNGHSLGGYLASAFTRLFGTQAHVQHTTTFNSAGFAFGSETAFQQLQNLIGIGYGIGRFPNRGEQTNYFASHGLNVTTNSFWFSQVGQRISLFNEESTGIPNHYVYKLTDTLALGDALAQLDSTLDFTRLNAILDAGSNEKPDSLEKVLDGLRRIFFGKQIQPTLVGDNSGTPPMLSLPVPPKR